MRRSRHGRFTEGHEWRSIGGIVAVITTSSERGDGSSSRAQPAQLECVAAQGHRCIARATHSRDCHTAELAAHSHLKTARNRRRRSTRNQTQAVPVGEVMPPVHGTSHYVLAMTMRVSARARPSSLPWFCSPRCWTGLIAPCLRAARPWRTSRSQSRREAWLNLLRRRLLRSSSRRYWSRSHRLRPRA